MVLLSLAAFAVPAASARADNGWNADLVAQSAQSVVLESGETATSWFEFKNVNQNGRAWERRDDAVGPVRLGTQSPQDRASDFRHDSWLQSNRVTRLDQETVPLNAVGRFTFIAQAPPVQVETAYAETFAPVAEIQGWMRDELATITYVVRPKVPPALTIDSAPATATLGSPVGVTATASDNVRVQRVDFAIGGLAPVSDATGPWEAQLPTAGLPAGPHQLVVTAYDGAGQATTQTRTVTLEPVGNGTGASRDAKLTAGFGRRLTPRHTVAYGRPDRVRGRLTTAAGAPIAGAALRIFTRVVLPRRGFRPVTTVTTDADGNYSYLAPRGPSRQIRVDYTAFSGDAAATATRLVRMSTQAGVRMSARKRGDTVRFSGRLRGGPKPESGLLVVLQGYQAGYGWRTFRTARVSSGGRFKTLYRWRTPARGTFRFRATVREQIGYAYATGRSREIRIRR
jgi:hypothetical protein